MSGGDWLVFKIRTRGGLKICDFGRRPKYMANLLNQYITLARSSIAGRDGSTDLYSGTAQA